MNYKIIPQNDIVSSIFETKTEQYVAMSLITSEAKELCRKLNFGSGFDGWTPSFFLTNIETYS